MARRGGGWKIIFGPSIVRGYYVPQGCYLSTEIGYAGKYSTLPAGSWREIPAAQIPNFPRFSTFFVDLAIFLDLARSA